LGGVTEGGRQVKGVSGSCWLKGVVKCPMGLQLKAFWGMVKNQRTGLH